jgi:hypothetical protein
MRTPIVLALIGLVCLQLPAQSAQKPKQEAHELLGFLLRQDRAAIETALGEPFNEQKRPDGLIAYAYHVPKAPGTYLVALYDKEQIGQIELTGTDYFGPTGFFGLKLGDSSDKVQSALGTPAKISHEDDVNVDLWDYQDSNYSLEFTADHKLYSIQIVFEPKGDPDHVAGSADVHSFAEAVRSHDIDKLIEMSSGEIECTSGEAFGIQTGPARALLADQTSKFSGCLKRAADAILALGPDMKGTSDEIRVWAEHAPGTVTKFPASSPLKEVVFVEEAGAWRVDEVTFR